MKPLNEYTETNDINRLVKTIKGGIININIYTHLIKIR